MSSFPDSTATPTADTLVGGSPTASSTRSMSWIIRSNTTSMSSERGWNKASRWASMNLGRVTCGRAAIRAGLKRSTCPTWSLTPVRRAASIMASASSTVAAIGFSTSRCRPAAAARSAAPRWATVGSAIETASQASSSSASLGKARHACASATARARAASASYTPTSSASGSAW